MTNQALEANKTVVQTWIDQVFNGRNLDAIRELKVGSYLDWTPFPTQHLDLPVSGLEQSLPEFLESLPDFRFTANELLAEGDFVVALGEWRATHRGDFAGISPTGKRVGGTRIDIFRVAGDKMVEHWGCGNELAFLELVGAVASRPSDQDSQGAEDVAERFLTEVVNERNLGSLHELVDHHAVDRSDLGRQMFFLISGFPDYRLEIRETRGEGDQVRIESTYAGTHTGYYRGLAPTGREVSGERVDLFSVSDGRIVEFRFDWDESALLEQIGC